eukprot:CAMPEP_0201537214 /NCGR_PEP_ID=MMETSP0161_2-20130828/64105_1 /ASSEMBLY_ACC=CAM_ASM_000251 /TAXON_ID=180227 /ORGANISM="Neoparamoeba aestuarina, Strain SoJaBio B1-5/56/2" /LENGTH=122 /DNA_ID=CAMNT_0047943369 /DNA_START=736 /DNA_END=1101 /DNA_ORIENTATION=+
MTVVDGDGSLSSSLKFKQEDEEREKATSEFYARQIVQIRKGLEETHQKLTQKTQQCDKVLSQAKALKAAVDQLTDEGKKKEIESQALRDELELTRNNYQSQIKMMSEHILTLNDRLATLEKK